MATIYQGMAHKSGIPLGGIGTGSVEIRPDGLFHEWHVFNNGPWNPNSPCCTAQEAMSPEDLLFMLRTCDAEGRVSFRYLALREELHNLYSLPWARSVESIRFDGTFPVARLTYVDEQLPVQVEAEVFSPFVPLDSRISGTPGFFVYFVVKNMIASPVDVSILGVMKNPVGYDQSTRDPVNRWMDLGSGQAIFMASEGLTQGHCSTGNMTFGLAGGGLSHVTGAYAEDHKAFTFWRSRYGPKVTSYLPWVYETGFLPNLNAEMSLKGLEGLEISKMSRPERQALLSHLCQYAAFHVKVERFRLVDPDFVESPEFLEELLDNANALKDGNTSWGWTGLCSKMEVPPEGESSAVFTVAWHFPNHVSPSKQNIGHMYENWFSSSGEVASFMANEFPELRRRTLSVAETLHRSSLPAEAADAVTSQLSTLTKCTWWTRDSHFGVWEGYGCCGFHTMDITYQGSFPIVALFPDLQKAQMTLGATFQRQDGRVHHFFTPDFSTVDNGFDRVDMNQQFVMLAARDYLWSGDRAYLEKLWPHIIRAMDNTGQLDADGDGLPDHDTRRNTYDAWDFSGCPSYISSLWLGALQAAIRLAKEMGDKERALKWQKEQAKGAASFDSKLWNGEYYMLWRDGEEVDECCMSDQMSGDWFCSACGWDPLLKPKRIRKALEAIFRHNFRQGQGLLNATYPPGKKRRLAANGNFQAEAPWTGIEYTVACLLIKNGRVSEGLAIVRDIHDRYMRAGRYWNHVECGGHYYRAMSSWTVLLALSGFAWDYPTSTLTFAPAIPEQACEYPFFTPVAWGSCFQENGLTGKAVVIKLNDGLLRIGTLRLPKMQASESAQVMVDSLEIDARVEAYEEGIQIHFDPPVTLTAEGSLFIAL